MKKLLTIVFVLTIATVSVESSPQTATPSHEVFWQKFRQAVIDGNKTAVADMSRLPVDMPYGMARVRNRTQLLRRYREVFEHDGSIAAKCFVDAKPRMEEGRKDVFSVGCANAGGDVVVIYYFTRGRGGWKFTALDNLHS